MTQLANRVCGRFAPSPTGYAHLGNAWVFLLAWLSVRSRNGRLLLRIEDIDPQRSKTEFTSAIVEDMRWLGLDWDEGPDVGGPSQPYLQSRRGRYYEDALAGLEAAGLTYPCFCTRKELRTLASAPHVEDMGAPYPGTCRFLDGKARDALRGTGRKPAVRLRCAEMSITFNDRLLGETRANLADCGGDFALRRPDGVVAYQLAVTVDDAAMGVTEIVRGRDIWPSTPRQVVLQKLLGYTTPDYMHVPLLLDNNGERLAKRHQSLTLRKLRQAGADARSVIGLLSQLAGINPSGAPAEPRELLPHFVLERLPKQDQRVTDEKLEYFIFSRGGAA